MASTGDNINSLLDFLQLQTHALVPALIILGFFIIAGTYVVYTDTTRKIIPNWFNYSLLLIGLVTAPFLFQHWVAHYITALITMIIFVIIAELARGKMGYGDVKLYTALAFFFGPAIILVILISNLAALLGGILIAKKQKKGWRGTPVSMAPFVFIASLVVILAAVSNS